MYTDMGFPEDTGSIPAGFESSVAVQPPSPVIVSDSDGYASGIWNKFKEWDDQASAWVVDTVKKDYQVVKSSVKTVANDVADIAGSTTAAAISPIYMYALIAIVVIGGVIYFAGKSGAVRVNAIV